MPNKKRLLIICHAPSENTARLADSLLNAASRITSNNLNASDNSGYALTVIKKPALEANADDVLNADAIILMTPENLGYMSGGMKDFFDRVYYPCLEEKQGLPIAAIIRAGQDGTGTKRALETITTGLKWRWVQAPLICRGPWQEGFVTQAEELAEAMAVALQQGMI
jgi:multimeric flavodoxin WrbA